MTDRYSHEYRMQCLARYYMRISRDTTHMELLFSQYENKAGKQSRQELREYVVNEQIKQMNAADEERRKQFGECA